MKAELIENLREELIPIFEKYKLTGVVIAADYDSDEFLGLLCVENRDQGGYEGLAKSVLNTARLYQYARETMLSSLNKFAMKR
jgi:hypothetical protein